MSCENKPDMQHFQHAADGDGDAKRKADEKSTEQPDQKQSRHNSNWTTTEIFSYVEAHQPNDEVDDALLDERNIRNTFKAAVEYNKFWLVRMILSKDESVVHARLAHAQNALTVACSHGSHSYVEIFNALLGVKEDLVAEQVKATNDKSWNALMVASAMGNVDFVKSLLLLDMDLAKTQVRSRNINGLTALLMVTSRGILPVVSVLIDVSLLGEEIVQLQMEATYMGRNALMIATKNRDPYTIDTLLSVNQKLVEIQLKYTDMQGYSALFYTAREGHANTTRCLLKYYWYASLLVPLFLHSRSDMDYVRISHGFEYTFKALATAMSDERVSARDLAVSYWCDMVQRAAEEAIELEAIFSKFMNLLHAAIDKLRRKAKTKARTVLEQALALFTKKYYGREYMNVYGEDMLALSISLIEMNDPDKEAQTKEEFIAERLSDPLTVAKIDRFLARHEPDDSPRVLDIERRIAALQSK